MLDEPTTPPGQLQDRIRVAPARSSEGGRTQILILAVLAIGVAVLASAIWLFIVDVPPVPTSEPGDTLGLIEDLDVIEPDLDAIDDRFESTDLSSPADRPDRSRRGPSAALGGQVVSDSKIADSPIDVLAWRIVDGEPRHRPRRTQLDSDGRFRFDPVAAGEYRLDVFGEGIFAASAHTVELAPGEELLDLRLELTRGCELSGHVRDEEGLPIEDAEVRATSIGEGPGADPRSARVVSSRRDGAYRIEGLRPGTAYLVAARRPHHSPLAEPEPLPIHKDTQLDITLRAEGVLAGRVLLQDDKPARVALVGRDVATRTDDQGYFRFAGVRAGDEPLELLAATVDLKWVGWNRFVYDGRNRHDVIVPLDASVAIPCKVVDSEGRGLPRVTIAVEEETTAGWQVPRYWALIAQNHLRTNNSGEATLDGLELEKRYRLREVDVRLLPQDQEYLLFNGLDAGPLQLVVMQGAVVHGRVTTTDGLAASGLQVRVQEKEDIVARNTVRDDGRYAIIPLYPGIYRVDVGWRDEPIGQWKEIELEVGSWRELDFQISGNSQIQGWVLDPGGGPIGGARVELTLEAGSFDARAETSEDGRYLFEELIPGRYRIEVTAPGWTPGRSAIELGWQESGERDVALEPAHELKVRVEGTAETVTWTLIPEVGPRQSSLSRADETFRFTDVAPGDAELLVHTEGRELVARRSVQVGRRSGAEPIRLVLERSHSIAGRVVHDGRGSFLRVGAALDRGGAADRRAGTNRDGTFRLEGLYPGEYFLSIQGSDQPPVRVVAGEQSGEVVLRPDG